MIVEAPIRILRYPHFMRNRYGDEFTVRGRHRLRRLRTCSNGTESTTERHRLIPRVRALRAMILDSHLTSENLDSDN